MSTPHTQGEERCRWYDNGARTGDCPKHGARPTPTQEPKVAHVNPNCRCNQDGFAAHGEVPHQPSEGWDETEITKAIRAALEPLVHEWKDENIDREEGTCKYCNALPSEHTSESEIRRVITSVLSLLATARREERQRLGRCFQEAWSIYNLDNNKVLHFIRVMEAELEISHKKGT